MQEKNNGTALLFDLIVLDLNMPISDGYETCKNILQKYDDRQMFKIDDKCLSQSRSKESYYEIHLRPLIVACSSDVIDDQKRK